MADVHRHLYCDAYIWQLDAVVRPRHVLTYDDAEERQLGVTHFSVYVSSTSPGLQVTFFTHLLVEPCSINPALHDVHTSGELVHTGPNAALPFVHLHAYLAAYAVADTATVSIDMSPCQLEPLVPLKRTWVVPAGRFSPDARHASVCLTCCWPVALHPVAIHVPATFASMDRLPVDAPYMWYWKVTLLALGASFGETKYDVVPVLPALDLRYMK